MNKYRVNLAASIPAIFEAVVQASSPESAYNKAIEAYDAGGGDYQEIMDKPKLIYTEPGQGLHARHAPGVHIAELKRDGSEMEV